MQGPEPFTAQSLEHRVKCLFVGIGNIEAVNSFAESVGGSGLKDP